MVCTQLWFPLGEISCRLIQKEYPADIAPEKNLDSQMGTYEPSNAKVYIVRIPVIAGKAGWIHNESSNVKVYIVRIPVIAGKTKTGMAYSIADERVQVKTVKSLENTCHT